MFINGGSGIARACLPACRVTLWKEGATAMFMSLERTRKIMRKAILAAFALPLLLSVSASAQPGGYGMGPGMMGGYGMGPGMMGGGGYGAGHGMMGGYGPGGMPAIPDLTKEQRDKIAGIQKEMRQKQWTLMEKMHDEFDAQNPYRSGKFDEQAARKAYETAEKLHRQMFENSLDAQKRIDSLLTPQQREQLQRTWGR